MKPEQITGLIDFMRHAGNSDQDILQAVLGAIKTAGEIAAIDNTIEMAEEKRSDIQKACPHWLRVNDYEHDYRAKKCIVCGHSL